MRKDKILKWYGSPKWVAIGYLCSMHRYVSAPVFEFALMLIVLLLYALAWNLYNPNRAWTSGFFSRGEEIANIFPAYITLSLAYYLALWMLLSTHYPGVPLPLLDYTIFLDKWGKTLFLGLSLGLYFGIKYLFLFIIHLTKKRYSSLDTLRSFYIDLYFVLIPILLVLGYTLHFYPNLISGTYKFCMYSLLGIFGLKLIGLIFVRASPQPKQLFLKLVYICTFQIVPVWILWNMLYL